MEIMDYKCLANKEIDVVVITTSLGKNNILNEIKLNNIKVAFLTAKNKTTDIEKGLKLGADKYLTKPFSIKKIVSEIFELIN